MTNENQCRMNDGTVPEGVGPDTMIEVEYRYGEKLVWRRLPYDIEIKPSTWTLDDFYLDIIRWRFV